jgi:hypothetical protein
MLISLRGWRKSRFSLLSSLAFFNQQNELNNAKSASLFSGARAYKEENTWSMAARFEHRKKTNRKPQTM